MIPRITHTEIALTFGHHQRIPHPLTFAFAIGSVIDQWVQGKVHSGEIAQ